MYLNPFGQTAITWPLLKPLPFTTSISGKLKRILDRSERYIETTPEDIRWANLLLKDVLLAKSDELPARSGSSLRELNTM